MPEKIFIGVAWPYANGSLHLGQFVSSQLPADILARYHRLRGDRVLMVSGSDQHGTPITVRADKDGVSPQEIVDRFHGEFLENWRQLGISWDCYTITGTPNHHAVTQDVFLHLLENGWLYKDTMELPYDPEAGRFLPDRYVEGTCPYCGFDGARGDQCDNCGRTLDPDQLLEPRSRISGARPEFRDSEHFFLKLSAFEDRLREWISAQTHWRKNVINFSLGMLNEGLKDRAITRDIDWGVPVPVPGFESKRIYVWFDAVIGYLSAAKEWAQERGEPEAWRDFWQDPACRHYYFVGKDNIVFHTIIWPTMLMGYGDLDLPYNVAATQYLTMSGSKASTSRNLAIWVPDVLARYDPDALRFGLAASMPETSDTDFGWADLVRRNNDELVATWGNLAHRVLTMVYRNFDGRVPEPGELDANDRRIMDGAPAVLETVGHEIDAARFRAAVGGAMAYAQEVNGYLNATAPWQTIKEDRQAAARSLYTALCAVNALKVALAPVVPFSSERLHTDLGFEGSLDDAGWAFVPVPPGQRLREPEPLFKKLDPVEAEA